MKLNLFFVPGSKNVCSKRLVAEKVFSTILTTLALAGAMLFIHSTGSKPSSDSLAAVQLEAENSVPLGLSRKRGAFNKAIDILADAADENPGLADYYVRVKKRVKGHRAEGENHSGVRAIRAADKIATPAVRALPVNTASMPLAAISESINNLARSVASLTQSEAKSAPDTGPGHRDADDSSSPAATQQFTVGDMAFDTNPAIEQWMNYYTSTPIGRRTMMIGIDRSNSYLEMARAEFRNAGVPEDLVWLAFVESVWNPKAVSPAAAGGIWQFIPATATDYGLTVQTGNDERADPFKQTRVAAAYLHDLYTIFGDWALAMAAYNSGEPRVMGAIVKNGRANFWDLYEKQLLPKETRDYVPKILAAIKIASLADDYGLAPQAAGF